MVSSHSVRKLSSYLVSGKPYPLERKVDLFRCQICLNVNETNSLATSVIKEDDNHCFNCNAKCLIFLLTCKVCLKQYVRQTLNELRLRCKNYRCNN